MLRRLSESIWDVECVIDIRGILRMPRRMTVVRLGDGGLVVHSPIAIHPQLRDAVAMLGRVVAVIAPNLKHDRWLSGWVEGFPEATLFHPAGFVAADSHVAAGVCLDSGWRSEELVPIHIGGMPELEEYVFVHRPSRTLIVADLIFNLHESTGPLSRVLIMLNGTWRKAAPSRFFRMLVKDRAALRLSLDRLLEHDFDRVIPGHGRVLESGGRAVVRAGFSWL